MKKNHILLATVLVFAIPAFALAATFASGEALGLRKDAVVTDNYYAVGANLSISGQTKEDVYAVAGNIFADGTINKDALLIGGNINTTGKIGEDLRIVGGQINVGSSIGGDLAIAGGQVHLLSGATVGKDLSIAGGKIVVDGPIKGDVNIAANDILLDASVGGEVTLRAEKITIGSNAVINGAINYYSNKEAVVEPGAKINKQITKVGDLIKVNKEEIKKGVVGLFGLGLLIKMLAMIVAGLVLSYVSKKASIELVTGAISNFGMNFLRGFVFMIVVPIAAIILLVTILGAPLGGLVGLLYAVTMIVGGIFAGIVLGSLIYKFILKKDVHSINWQIIIVGNIVLYFLALIPIVGWIICFACFMVSLGSLWDMEKRKMMS